jgi:hypothetical protein
VDGIIRWFIAKIAARFSFLFAVNRLAANQLQSDFFREELLRLGRTGCYGYILQIVSWPHCSERQNRIETSERKGIRKRIIHGCR